MRLNGVVRFIMKAYSLSLSSRTRSVMRLSGGAGSAGGGDGCEGGEEGGEGGGYACSDGGGVCGALICGSVMVRHVRGVAAEIGRAFF